MSSTVVNPQPAEEPKPFDAKAFITARNSGKPIEAKTAETKPAAAETKPAAIETEPHLSRSARRDQNRLREEIGELKGRLKAYEELGLVKPGKEGAGSGQSSTGATADPEPQRSQFATDAEHVRALSRWDARQEAAKLLGKQTEAQQSTQQLEAYRDHLKAMDAKAAEDMKSIADWDTVAKEAAENEDAIEFSPDDHPTLMGLLASSDVKAFVLYHFAKNQEELQKMLDLTKTPDQQIRAFHRLEGRIEKLYSVSSSKEEKPAAQAAPPAKAEKDRISPEKAEQARATAERDAQKPRPSTEVAARGGSAPPEEPAIGSAAWMARRNQAQYAK